MTPSASLVTSAAGQTIQNLDVIGTITVNRPNVTIRNVCVTDSGRSVGGSIAIQLSAGADNTLIEDSSIAGANATTDSVEMAVANDSSRPATLERDYLYNCGECVHDGPWTVNNSYIISNGMRGTGEHYEDVYYNGDVPGAMSFTHDTMFNPFYQTAVIFSDTYGDAPSTCRVPLTVKASLIAGGEYMLTYCGKATRQGAVRMDIEDNHFARCTAVPFRTIDQGNKACSGNSPLSWEIPTIRGFRTGTDLRGYWPQGGSYTPNSMGYCGTGMWSGNVWDDNRDPVPCS